MLDFCRHFENYTGIKDCKTENETLEVVNQIKVEAKISHEFYNAYTYVMNGL